MDLNKVNRKVIIGLAVITALVSYKQISPNLSGYFGSKWCVCFFLPAFIPVLFGIFVKDAPKSAVIASSIVAIVVHFERILLGLDTLYNGEVRNPAVASAIAIVASLMTGIIFLMVDRKKKLSIWKKCQDNCLRVVYLRTDCFQSIFQWIVGRDVDTWFKEKFRYTIVVGVTLMKSSADLAEAGYQTSIENAGLLPEQIDLLIIATDTPEFISPSTASKLCG